MVHTGKNFIHTDRSSEECAIHKNENSDRTYRNDPKFSDRHTWANSADPDQTALIRVYTVCHSVCIVWTHYSMVEPHSSNFRVITTNVLGVRIFRKFTVCEELFSNMKSDPKSFWGVINKLNTSRNDNIEEFDAQEFIRFYKNLNLASSSKTTSSIVIF